MNYFLLTSVFFLSCVGYCWSICQNLLHDVVTNCVDRRYFTKCVARCCHKVLKQLFQNAATVMTKCVGSHKMRRCYRPWLTSFLFWWGLISNPVLALVSIIFKEVFFIWGTFTHKNSRLSLEVSWSLFTAISIYVVGSKPQAYNPESLKLILIYPYRLSVLSRTLKALIRQRKLK